MRSLIHEEHLGDESMWMESEAEKQSYEFHEESWSSGNKYQKQFPGKHKNMHMNMNRHGAYAMDSESDLSMSKHEYGKLAYKPRHFQGESMHIDNRGGRKLPFGGHHEYFSEAYTENHGHGHGHGTAKVDEMRYERRNWGGEDIRYVNPYDRTLIRNMNHKPHWTSKGV
ncbi:hypothetical protein VNO78_28416 [Psophocarpus tetragonolobus]|uniref:Uncharacterized protein n=1 Tax=Psophocarpus tetragonolobus TaxID=3891 RepID=A0AAN9S2L4_PSOTE